ncbi:MAG: O-methyltransferase [Crocinitomicaceae bacterium]
MMIDYLRYIFRSISSSEDISINERKFLEVISNSHSEFNDIEIKRRASLLKNSSKIITVSDFGAGSKAMNGKERQVSKIAKYASIQPKFGQLFASIIKELNLHTCIELGTSFGIGTSYLALNAEEVITIEGCPNIANIASETFNILKIKNIKQKVGEFKEVLASMSVPSAEPLLVYIDGNHRYKPTIEYFEFFKTVLPEDSIIIFDDIYWSKGMKKAWANISQQPYFTVDLFKVGIVLLKERSAQASVTIRF